MAKLKINRGTTFNIGVNYQVNGVAASLVGATLRFTVKANEYDAVVDDTGAAIIKNVTSHTDPANGVSNIAILPTDTATMTPGTYHYDIKVKDASGNVYKLDEGTILLDASPTNRLV